NAVRHNLSLHSRFVRMKNEGAGKSSWWVVDPYAGSNGKPGKYPRRRAATIESSTKSFLEQKRREAKIRVEMARMRSHLHSTGSFTIGSMNSVMSHDIYNDQDEVLNANFNTLHRRTHSNLSITRSNSRISPTLDEFEDSDFPPPLCSLNNQERLSNLEINEITRKTNQMRFDSNSNYLQSNFGYINGGMGMESRFEPSYYQNMNGICPQRMAPMQPMMRSYDNILQNQQPSMQEIGMNTIPNDGYCQPMGFYNNDSMMPPQDQWQPNPMDPQEMMPQQCQSNFFDKQQADDSLPLDLENVNLSDHEILDLDLNAIIKHEMDQSMQDQSMNYDEL
ncbi:hypothetical protein FO519_007798, partial [Halicephalobus sp. NKZ332]